MSRILVTGAAGQLGSELTRALRRRSGAGAVVASDIVSSDRFQGEGPWEQLDIMDRERLEEVVQTWQIRKIYHLAAMLSAKAEEHPKQSWRLNVDGLIHVLDVAAAYQFDEVFWPSSIAVFGPDAPSEGTPQDAALNPESVYGISKVAGEQWCAWYHRKHGVDVRSLRYPGLISYLTPPGGGTTDYAVELYRHAARAEHWTCYLERGTRLPMMYIDDAVRAAIQLMEAPSERLTVRTSYNITAVSFTPEELEQMVRERIPSFRIGYKPDFRQEIARTWPAIIDDRVARDDWGWQHEFGLERMTEEMLSHLGEEGSDTTGPSD